MTKQTNTTDQDYYTKNPNTLINKTVKNLKIRKLKDRNLITGTGRNGYIKANYDELEELFDRPAFFDLTAYKTRAEWLLIIGNAFIAIYDIEIAITNGSSRLFYRIGTGIGFGQCKGPYDLSCCKRF